MVLQATTFFSREIIINNYPIEHQGVNTLALHVDYQAKKSAAPSEKTENSRIYQLLNQLIINYPHETDFWEVLNCYLTKNLLARVPNLLSVTLTLAVHPNSVFPYHRSSTVTQTSRGIQRESFHFDFRSRVMEKIGPQFSQINVDYTYKPNPSKSDYPDFIPIYQQIDNFLSQNFSRYPTWEVMQQQLRQTLLQENPRISSLSLEWRYCMKNR